MSLGFLTRGRFLRQVDGARVQRAVEDAERRTSGEIAVSIARFFWGDVQKAAERAFDRLRILHTRDRNGVLIFVVPSRRQFVILGDRGIHERAGQPLWDRAAAAMSTHLLAGDVTGALEAGIAAIAGELAVHFPYAGERDVNELPDAPELGGR